MYYAIEKIGCKHTHYTLRKVINKNSLAPVTGKAWRTLERAQQEAHELGIKISKVGDLYEII